MPTLLFEIGCEELPAAACREAAEQLPQLCLANLGKAPERLLVGPRRLAVLVHDLPERTPDEVRRGPAERMAFDEEGRPTLAAEGFARSLGLAPEELERRDGHVWGTVRGVRLAEVLPERLAGVVRGLTFGRSMVWRAGGLRFSRPVRWLCAKLDGETLRVSLEGIPSGGISYGHRFTSGPLEIPDAVAYVDVLRAAGVEPDPEERRRQIAAELDAIGDWSDPGGVLEEVIHLVESPVVVEGSFDERFLALPQRVIVAAMQSHQRYFPLGGARFAFAANGGDPELVRAGNERVLEGRLEDASFTFERDLEQGIDALTSRLPSITFAAGAGSMADKTARLLRLVEALGGGDASREAARLAKADQAAELVREFPDLEGHVGAEYARLAGYPEEVCAAIEEQYLPDSAGGALPATPAGRVLAAAEKIDNLTVAFSLGERPTGSRDPYGLRRAAIGLCRLAVEAELVVDLAELVTYDHRLLAEQGAEVEDVAPLDLPDWIAERLEGLLDVPVEFVRAARAAASLSELGAIARLATALRGAFGTDAFEAAATVYERAERLAGRASAEAAARYDAALASDDAERELAQGVAAADAAIREAAGARDFAAGIEAAAVLAPAVERFFEDVLVMAEDAAVRANRLRLLLDLRDAVKQVGDLSQIPR